VTVKDNHGACGTVADVAVGIHIIERDGVGLAEAANLAKQRAGFDVDHLHRAAVRDVKALRLGIDGEVIPVPCSANRPVFANVKRIAGELCGRGDGRHLRGQWSRKQQRKYQRPPHGTQLLTRFDARNRLRVRMPCSIHAK